MNIRKIMTSTPTLMVLTVLMVTGALCISNEKANANPSSFVRSSSNSAQNVLTSTSTQVAALAGGQGTTTIVLNGTLGSNFAINTVALSLFRMASSGRQVNKIDIQYSNNCDATIPDWYSTHGSSTAAITGPIFWPFASTTPFSGGTANDSDQIEIQLGNVPTRCVRAVITSPVGTLGSSTMWGELTGKKEVY